MQSVTTIGRAFLSGTVMALAVAGFSAGAALAQAPQSKFADVEGVKLHYLVAGQGDPVVLLHGYAETSRMWRPLIPRLAEHFIVLLYNINGRLGGDPTVPVLVPLQMFFVCLCGTLIGLWCIARYLKPIGLFALIDGWGRVWVSLLIVWFGVQHGQGDSTPLGIENRPINSTASPLSGWV